MKQHLKIVFGAFPPGPARAEAKDIIEQHIAHWCQSHNCTAQWMDGDDTVLVWFDKDSAITMWRLSQPEVLDSFVTVEQCISDLT